jgi:hypothetical protein
MGTRLMSLNVVQLKIFSDIYVKKFTIWADLLKLFLNSKEELFVLKILIWMLSKPLLKVSRKDFGNVADSATGCDSLIAFYKSYNVFNSY